MKTVALREYVFKDDLLDSPIIITTLKHPQGWITVIENLPVHTFRGNAYKQDVLAINKSWREAKKYHNEVVKGKK